MTAEIQQVGPGGVGVACTLVQEMQYKMVCRRPWFNFQPSLSFICNNSFVSTLDLSNGTQRGSRMAACRCQLHQGQKCFSCSFSPIVKSMCAAQQKNLRCTSLCSQHPQLVLLRGYRVMSQRKWVCFKPRYSQLALSEFPDLKLLSYTGVCTHSLTQKVSFH